MLAVAGVAERGSDDDAGARAGWLQIVRQGGTAEAYAYCPYRGRMLRVQTCFACPDCSGLALSPRSRDSYVVCERAAADGLRVEAVEVGDSDALLAPVETPAPGAVGERPGPIAVSVQCAVVVDESDG